MLKVGIIIGSTRPGRNTLAVAQWFLGLAEQRKDADYELVDIEDYHLPLLDEPIPPSMGQYRHEHTKRWAHKIDSFDAFVFVTPEYNHGVSGALKNALDFIYKEWNNKACGFVSFGSGLGIRSVEHLRQIAAELQLADVRSQVALSLMTDFENMSVFKPHDYHVKTANTMLDQLLLWGEAMKAIRTDSLVLTTKNSTGPRPEASAQH